MSTPWFFCVNSSSWRICLKKIRWLCGGGVVGSTIRDSRIFIFTDFFNREKTGETSCSLLSKFQKKNFFSSACKIGTWKKNLKKNQNFINFHFQAKIIFQDTDYASAWSKLWFFFEQSPKIQIFSFLLLFQEFKRH